jgi:hypothetical protein
LPAIQSALGYGRISPYNTAESEVIEVIMNDMYVSPSALASLEKEFPVYSSPIRLAISTILFLGIAFGASYSGLRDIPNYGWANADVIPLGLAAVCFFVFFRSILGPLMQLGKPVVILSVEGITFGGKPLLPWNQILKNEWNESRSRGFRSHVAIRLQLADGKKVYFNATFLKIKGSEYLRQCELYRYASQVR